MGKCIYSWAHSNQQTKKLKNKQKQSRGIRYVCPVLTQGHQMMIVFQHHCLVEDPLLDIQKLPFCLGEVHGHIFKRHWHLKQVIPVAAGDFIPMNPRMGGQQLNWRQGDPENSSVKGRHEEVANGESQGAPLTLGLAFKRTAAIAGVQRS